MNNIESIKNKTLVLTQTDPKEDMMFNAWIEDSVKADIIFKDQPKPIRLIRRLFVDNFMPGYSLWYGDWKNKIDEFDTVIIHADTRTRTVPKYIHKIKPSMRIIYWYWNPVNKKTLPQLTKDENIELWSFDINDCKKYHMNQNIQYYYLPNIENGNIENDVYFVGHDKGRTTILNKIKDSLIKNGLRCRFDIIGDSQKNIPYNEVQKNIAHSKAILEVNQDGQVGCTLRALESLFFKKKLITTNQEIIKEDFYNKDNVFIYGKDNLKEICDFINKSYNDESDKYQKVHTIDAWLLNFFDGE